jgi:hypothetical protein
LYTSAKLTFASDRLVAISAIARKAFGENKNQYLANLCRKDLELQLLWVRVAPGRRLSGSTYHAPSWSWASVDEEMPVHYYPRFKGVEYSYYAHVLSAIVVPSGKDAFGEIEGGELRMSCSVMLAGKLKKLQYEDLRCIGSNHCEVEMDSRDGGKENFKVHPDSDEFDSQDIYVLPALQILGDGKYNEPELEGLIILPTGSKKGEYPRVGHFRFWSFDDDRKKTQDRFLGLLEASGKATAEARCADILEEPRFGEE